jgi:hypothetical protein
MLDFFTAIGMLSFDFGVISGFFCLAKLTFFQSLLSLTGSLVALAFAILVRSFVVSRRTSAPQVLQDGIFTAVYLLLLMYPVVSTKVVETFAW